MTAPLAKRTPAPLPAVVSFAHRRAARILYVRLRTGEHYAYHGVPHAIFQLLADAKAKGVSVRALVHYLVAVHPDAYPSERID